MSDMASPILFVMGSESHAYIAFSALMERLKDNFTTTGAAMTLKFEHLAAALNYHDQEFFSYLERHNVTSLHCINDVECNSFVIIHRPVICCSAIVGCC